MSSTNTTTLQNDASSSSSSSPQLQQQQQQNQQQQPEASSDALLTKKALALSLSPPRAPPYGSLHRHVLMGGRARRRQRYQDARRFSWARHYHVTEERHLLHKNNSYKDDNHDSSKQQNSRTSQNEENNNSEAKSAIPHDTVRQRLVRRLFHHPLPHSSYHDNSHPHLPLAPEWSDQVTRWLGAWLPLSWQNYLRDSGGFRTLVDGLVAMTAAPLVPVTAPSAAWIFVQRSLRLQQITYGKHSLQYIQLLLPKGYHQSHKPHNNKNGAKTASALPPPSLHRLVVFVHGGAWGSGMPWMYRLVAHAQFLDQHQWGVAIVGYRTYPDGTVDAQVEDCQAAVQRLQRLHPSTPMTLVGHSSGAHVCLLWLVNRAIDQLRQQQQQQQALPQTTTLTTNGMESTTMVDSFVGLSGPYDISHHFDYEAARGVEELSPMKPACGLTRPQFTIHSPAQRLKAALAEYAMTTTTTTKTTNAAVLVGVVVENLLPPMALIHGVEDETVPFTSTGEAARVLRSCGITRVDEIYLAQGVAHQDTVMHLMLGGPALDETVRWIETLEQENNNEAKTTKIRQSGLSTRWTQESSSSSGNNNDRRPTKLVARSKL
ncbi:hypothetical protein ACA910_009060 [Epithemia clementina (nom. ined.)]